jgi:DNA polymerase-3 subunit epsilon
VRRIEWIETAGEFGALVTEARLIKERRPLLNRRLHGSGEFWAIELGSDANEPKASIVPLDPAADPGESYGLFCRPADAGRALDGLLREYELCAKAIGLERAEGSCIGYQLGRCRGVCVGSERPALHALRVRLALSGLKRRDWPFPGPIGIRERDWRGIEETYVFDCWRFLGMVPGADDSIGLQHGAGTFDPDIYRILLGFLERPVAGAELLQLPVS